MVETEAINIGTTTITTAYFLEDKQCIVLCSNDKNINFYDVEQKKINKKIFCSRSLDLYRIF